MNDLTTQGCEREFRADERAEVREDRRLDEEVRYAPRGPEDPTETMGAEFFRAALDLSNTLGLLASGELDAGNQVHRLAIHRAFGVVANEFFAARREFYRVCVEARMREGDRCEET